MGCKMLTTTLQHEPNTPVFGHASRQLNVYMWTRRSRIQPDQKLEELEGKHIATVTEAR